MKWSWASWLNKNIIALGFVSLFSDMSSEIITVLLPTFLLSLGGSAAVLGIIEGLADASVSFTKIGAGWYSDYLGKRKPFAFVGYLLAAGGIACFMGAFHWYQVLIGRLITRFGKGVRDPARDAWLTESTTPPFYGRVFGFHRAMDTVGAIIGPLLAFFLIKIFTLRMVFFIALVPMIITLCIIGFFTHDSQRIITKERPRLTTNIRTLPPQFKLFLLTSGVFSLGKITPTLLLLRSTELLSSGQSMLTATSSTIGIYVLYNVCYALFSLPMGYLADTFGTVTILFFGYVCMACALFGFMIPSGSIISIGLLFIVAGIAIAAIDAIERSMAAELLPASQLGTGYGTLSALQGIGALSSSAMVGILWSAFSPQIGFLSSGFFCLLGAFFLYLFFIHKKHTLFKPS
ncbi:MAG TPA: MFS transporter [Candidatus Limnocylindria bacterium]|nr:MFS transporter [Candidatus Limnocylindria bacterium]